MNLLLCFLVLILTGCEDQEDQIASARLSPVVPAEKSMFYSPLMTPVTCRAIESGVPHDVTDDFLISDTVYLHLTWTGITGESTVEVHWITPGGKVQDKTLYSFYGCGDRDISWHYLKLFDNGKRLEMFVGEWTAHVVLNGRTIGKTHFTLRYP